MRIPHGCGTVRTMSVVEKKLAGFLVSFGWSGRKMIRLLYVYLRTRELVLAKDV